MKRFDIIFFVICFFSVVFIGSAFATCSGDPGACPPPLNDIDLNGLPDSADPYYTYKGIAIGQPQNYYVRTMADVTSDGHPDLIGFGEKGVFVAPYNENEGDFDSPQLWTREYASVRYAPPFLIQGWNTYKHLRLLADVNGDGAADIVGFGSDGVRVSIADPAGKSFNGYEFWSNEFGWNDDWKNDNSIRMLGDVNNDGFADIIGFRDKVYVALSNGTNGFDTPLEYDFSATSYICCRSPWNAKDNPTFLGDVDNDGFLDIIGFGTNNVRVVKNLGVNGSGQFLGFGSQVKGSSDFCEDDNAGGSNNWSTSKHLRYIAEVDNDGHADIVGFGDNGVYVAFGQSDGTFDQQVFKGIFGYENGWELSHPRILADVDGDGDLDIVGFGRSSVEVSMFDNTTKTFGDTVTVSPDAVHHSGRGWYVARHPRFMADLNNDNKADIIGLANMGARVSISSSTTTPDYEPTETLSTQFGYDENAGMWQPDKAIYGKFALPITMLMFSDPQFYQCSSDEESSWRSNNNRIIMAMNHITSWVDTWPTTGNRHYTYNNRNIPKPFGVVINGDLTSYGSQDGNLDTFKNFYHKKLDSQYVLFPGLGNHDLSNTFADYDKKNDDWGGKWCGCNKYADTFADDMLKYIVDVLKGNDMGLGHPRAKSPTSLLTYKDYKKDSSSHYSGSFSYSWDIGPFHFIQLHDRPDYNKRRLTSCVDNWFCGTEKENLIRSADSGSSDTWLKRDLAYYGTGKKIIINVHNFPGKTAYDNTFIGDSSNPGTLQNYDVWGIFSGHKHTLGKKDEVTIKNSNNDNKNVPYYRCGYGDMKTFDDGLGFLLVELNEDYMTVGTIKVTRPLLFPIYPLSAEDVDFADRQDDHHLSTYTY
jgi:hypothetical protein